MFHIATARYIYISISFCLSMLYIWLQATNWDYSMCVVICSLSHKWYFNIGVRVVDFLILLSLLCESFSPYIDVIISIFSRMAYFDNHTVSKMIPYPTHVSNLSWIPLYSVHGNHNMTSILFLRWQYITRYSSLRFKSFLHFRGECLKWH